MDNDLNSGRCPSGRATHEPSPQAVLAVPVSVPNAEQFWPSDYNRWGELVCRSCEREADWRSVATHVAHAPRNDGGSLQWPVCESHMQWAMIGGWFPVVEIAEWRDAQGMSAGTAETLQAAQGVDRQPGGEAMRPETGATDKAAGQ